LDADRRHGLTATDVQSVTVGQLLLELPDLDADVHHAATINLEATQVRRLVRALPMRERKVIIARYGLMGEALSCRQLAALMNISPSGVSVIEHRALERLRGMYGLQTTA
jgi:RNA polymerase sigma factor (sigma-70 family)